YDLCAGSILIRKKNLAPRTLMTRYRLPFDLACRTVDLASGTVDLLAQNGVPHRILHVLDTGRLGGNDDHVVLTTGRGRPVGDVVVGVVDCDPLHSEIGELQIAVQQELELSGAVIMRFNFAPGKARPNEFRALAPVEAHLEFVCAPVHLPRYLGEIDDDFLVH